MLDDEQPQHKHDCDACTFLGRYLGFDLYTCGPPDNAEIVARRSSEGPDYYSAGRYSYNTLNPISPAYEALIEAMNRASSRGLLTT